MSTSERESLVEIVEGFKNGLMAQATDGTIDPELYARGRRTLLGAKQVADLVPRFIRTCHNPEEFWQFIKSEFPNYAGRRSFLVNQINPIIERLEQTDIGSTGQFELGERIGQGGFGTVYKVHHELLKMDFAIKVFDPAFDDGNHADLDRFFREARVLFALHHPNIIRVYDTGLIGQKPFIRMEYFEGQNLNEFLNNHGVLHVTKARVLTHKVTSAISHAHQRGVVHRDIKPSNIMLAARQDVRVIDFGLGVFVEADLLSRVTKTGEHAVGGYYTAPELVTNPRLLNPSTDVYSIGALWFTALTGRPPAGSDLHTRLDESGESGPFLAVLRKSLASENARFANATEMLEAMDSAASAT